MRWTILLLTTGCMDVDTGKDPGLASYSEDLCTESGVANLNINISEASCRVRDDGSAVNTFRFGVRDLEALHAVSSRLRTMSGVLRVDRA